MAEKKAYYKYSKKGESKPKAEYKPKRGPLSKLMSEEEKQKAVWQRDRSLAYQS